MLEQFDAELDASRNDADFAGCDFEDAELGVETDGADLRNNQHFTVGVRKEAIAHGGVGSIEMDGNARLHGGVAIAAKVTMPSRKSVGLLRQRQWVPAKLIRRGRHLVERAAAHEAHGEFFVRAMRDRGTDAIGPGAAVGGARRGKGRAAELLGVEAEGMLLRGVLAVGQRARNSLGGELVAEAGLISDFVGMVSPLIIRPFRARRSASCIAS